MLPAIPKSLRKDSRLPKKWQIPMTDGKNQIIETNGVEKSQHILGRSEKDDGKMKVYPYGLLKIKEIKNDLAQIPPDP